MNAITGNLGSTKQEKFAWLAKQLPLIFITIALVIFDVFIIGQGVSDHWLPILGLALGIGLACLGFGEITFLRKRCAACEKRIITDEKLGKIVLISGRLLSLLGAALVVLENSIALVFNIHWLQTFGDALGLSLLCIGTWMLILFTERYKDDRKWRRMGFLFCSLLLVEALFTFGFGW